MVSDATGSINISYIVPLVCFLVVLAYASMCSKRPSFNILTSLFVKRYCQTLTLVDDDAMIAKYVEAHAHVWPEIIEGQRQVGIMDMQIYRHGRSLFMIMDTVDDLSVIWQG